MTRPTGFRREGPAEVYTLANKLVTMVDEESNNGEFVTMKNLIDGLEYVVPVKKIYPKRPHITADNHFSGEKADSGLQ